MKRLVVLNFFPAFYPPRSGGELRLGHLYAELARRFRIDLVSWTYPDRPAESVRLAEGFTDHRIPKTPDFDLAYQSFARQGITGEVSGTTCGMVGRCDTPYHALAASLIAEADAVVHDCPYTLFYDRGIGLDGRKRIYNAHNFEAEMVRSLTPSQTVQDFVYDLERRLAAQADLVFATSAEERLKFRALHGVADERLALCPNGIADAEFDWVDEPGLLTQRERAPADRLTCLFLGSDHPPNVEAGRFILEGLAPAFPATDFVIAGSVCHSLGGGGPANLALLGPIDDAAKHRILRQADLFLNPIARGAGTSLKVLEAMAARLPVLSTEAGIRGLGLRDGVEIAVAAPAAFARRLMTLLARPDDRAELAAAARQTALRRFSWRSIADHAADRIDELLAAGSVRAAPPRRLVLAANDYSVARPVAGGAVRVDRLVGALAVEAEIVLIVLGSNATLEIEALRPGFYEIRVPRTAEHLALAERVNAGHPVTVDDIVAGILCTRNFELVSLFQRLAGRASAIVFSHPYLLPLLQLTGKSRRTVLDLHNVELALKADTLHGHPDADLLVPVVEALEAYGCAAADAIVAVGEADAGDLARRYGAAGITIIANGTDLCPADAVAEAASARMARDWSRGFTAIFIGSAHPPNIDAVRFLVRAVLPELPAMRLVVVGAVGQSLEPAERVEILGVVPDDRKRSALLEADLALNPVMTGGGSNLKLGDYLGHGLPVVTTPVGARGFAVADGTEVLVAPPEAFAAAIGRLASEPELRARLASNGRRFAAESLDWTRLGAAFRAIVSLPAVPRRRLRVLVATYRYTEPPLGGAEDYLANLLRALGAAGDVELDLYAPSIDWIVNLSRFIAYASPLQSSPARVVAPFIRKIRLFDPDRRDEPAEEAACWRLFHTWRTESLALGRKLAPHLDRPLLLGGWNAAERSADGIRRASSGAAEIFVPAGYERLRLDGVHGLDQPKLAILVNGRRIRTLRLASPFAIEIPLDPAASNLVHLAIDGRQAPSGVLIEAALELSRATLFRVSGEDEPVELAEDYESHAARHLTDRWVDWIVETAEARSPEADADFRALRGPHSAALLDELRLTARDYDVMLVQGVPFGLSAEVAAVAEEAGVPYVVLPHFHVEDRFYHWREYYRLFAGAASVLSFSTGLAGDLVRRVGGRPVLIPGGGIEPSEFAYRAFCEQAFRTVHRSERPYFLVLGRKSGSKRCDLVVEAWQAIRDELGVDLLFIGPAEGAVIPDSPGLYNYDRSSRPMVLGALAGCVALATMSESESFGIVLLEAWMSERPVIANRGTLAFSELVEDGTDGLLVREPAELADAMRRLASDPKLAAGMGRNGRDKAETYSWARLAVILRETLAAASDPPSTGGKARSKEST